MQGVPCIMVHVHRTAMHAIFKVAFCGQALAKMEFSKFKESVKGYDFSFTKPPRNSDAFQQVCYAFSFLSRHNPWGLFRVLLHAVGN